MTKVAPQNAYVVWCLDHEGPEPAQLREDLAQAHFAHIETAMDKILIAGPLKNEDGIAIGSMLVFNVESEAEARELLAQDPYAGAKIWKTVEVRKFLTAAGDWIGGKIW